MRSACNGFIDKAMRGRSPGIEKSGDGYSSLFSALENVCGDRGGLSPKLLSWWIRRHADRIVDGRRFVRVGVKSSATEWAVGFSGFRGFSQPNVGNGRCDTLYKELEKTPKTPKTHVCQACVNFDPNGSGNGHVLGFCERTHGGRPTRAPGDGADCPAFEHITHREMEK